MSLTKDKVKVFECVTCSGLKPCHFSVLPVGTASLPRRNKLNSSSNSSSLEKIMNDYHIIVIYCILNWRKLKKWSFFYPGCPRKKIRHRRIAKVIRSTCIIPRATLWYTIYKHRQCSMLTYERQQSWFLNGLNRQGSGFWIDREKKTSGGF